MTAAYFLAQQGYKSIIYEAMPEAGGMMRYGIPEHRLPRTVLDNEIENIKRYGVEIQTNVRVGKDISFAEIKRAQQTPFSWAWAPGEVWICGFPERNWKASWTPSHSWNRSIWAS